MTVAVIMSASSLFEHIAPARNCAQFLPLLSGKDISIWRYVVVKNPGKVVGSWMFPVAVERAWSAWDESSDAVQAINDRMGQEQEGQHGIELGTWRALAVLNYTM